ncbi:MAG: LuxR C-terminal-related transcriptional regulator [Actinobacteria bacterium]|nr:LuxR C-terminal-related transcriptional regulator [Actinomycetota bacterium]
MSWPFSGREEELRFALRQLTGSSPRGVAVVGPPYVGRTRFLRELARRLPDNMPAHQVVATRTARALSFACLGSLAPASVEVPRRWLDELVERCGGPGAALVIDDAQWCDPATAQLLVEAAVSGRLRLALALRDGHRAPAALVTLWKDGHLARVDLDPLTRPRHERLVTEVLGGHVSEALQHELWDLSRGYPLVLREYLEGGVAVGTIVEVEGVWVGHSPLEPPDRYVDLVRQLLADLPTEVAEAMHLIALGEPLQAEILDQLVPPEVVAALERGAVVMLDPETERYSLTAPGARMAVRAALEPATMRSLSKRLSATMIDQDLHEDDLVRLAIWRLDAGDVTDNSLFVRAATRTASTFDHELTERLARAALPGGGIEAEILLANALIHQHRNEEAEVHLATAADLASNDWERARVAGVRSRLLFLRLGRMDEGIAVLEEACDIVEDEDVIDQLRGSLALLVSMRGDLDEAIQLCRLVLDREGAEDASKVVAATSAAFAHVLRGDLAEGLAIGAEGLSLPAGRVERDYPMARPMLEWIVMLGTAYLGDLDAAEERGRRGYRTAIESGADELAGVWASQLAGLLTWRGRVDDALPLAAEGRRLLTLADPMGVRSLAYAVGACASADAGDVDAVERLLDGMRAAQPVVDVRGRLLEERATAMGLAAAGELERATDLILASTEFALEHDHWTWGAFTAYHAVRYGRPDGTVEVIEEAARRGQGRLLPAIAAHARSLSEQDVDRLVDAAQELATIGVTLWAAEAYAQAYRLAGGDGDRSRAPLLRARAVALVQRCPGAMTPAVRGLRVTPLTRREHEVALLAANGLTSPQIAERLVVSVRTVDNHLASVYRKLDIAGRDELPAALAVDL